MVKEHCGLMLLQPATPSLPLHGPAPAIEPPLLDQFGSPGLPDPSTLQHRCCNTSLLIQVETRSAAGGHHLSFEAAYFGGLRYGVVL